MTAVQDYYPVDGQDGVVVHKPGVTYIGDAFKFVDEEGEDRFRVDEQGGVGCEGLHVAPGQNMEGVYSATGYAIEIDKRADSWGLIVLNPILTEPDTGQSIASTRDYITCTDRRSTPAKNVFRVNKSGYLISSKNAAPASDDLAVGEFTTWFDPAAGTFKVTGRKNDGTLVTKTFGA